MPLTSCASLMTRKTESVLSDISFASSHAAYQADADSVLWRYEILSDILAVTFLIKYCGLLD